MKLALYSDQIIPANRDVDAALAPLLPAKARIGYIPSAKEPERRFFNQRRTYYAEAGWSLCAFYEPEEPDPTRLEALISCDAIHLSGGNTSNFRARLERAGMMPVLREYVASGGVLIGTSAGGIMLTPTIAIDAIYRTADPQAERGNQGLGLLGFEFFPHAVRDTPQFAAVVKYTYSSATEVLGCPDGSGIVVDGSAVKLIGHGWRIHNGVVADWRPA